MRDDQPSEPVRLIPKAVKRPSTLGVSVRTIDRWIDAGILARPAKINGRDYFQPGDMPSTERASAA